jgi:hypothetical protein
VRLRWLALYPLVYAAAFLAVAGWLQGGDADRFVVGQRIFLRLLAAAGCCAAASVFQGGDRLRRAWFWLGAGTLLILARDVLRLAPPFSESSDAQAVGLLTALAILSNLCQLAGIWMLARSWRVVTLELPGGRAGMAAIAAITAAVALGVAGPGALQAMRSVAGGHWDDLVLVASALADIVSLCLIAPLLLTAMALRGGLFFWPWALITASRLSWLLYDAAVALASRSGFPLPDLFRGLAQNLLCAAGLAQFLVVRHVRNRARVTPAGKS